MEKLIQYTDEILREELKRREKIRIRSKIPRMGVVVNYAELRYICSQYIESLHFGEEFHAPLRQIFECAMTIFYGSDILGWIYKTSGEENQAYAQKYIK